jgi:hypothetical protein
VEPLAKYLTLNVRANEESACLGEAKRRKLSVRQECERQTRELGARVRNQKPGDGLQPFAPPQCREWRLLYIAVLALTPEPSVAQEFWSK